MNKRIIKSNDEGGGGPSFNTIVYQADGTATPITGVGFQPDFVWIKGRTLSSNHNLTDSVRGALNVLSSNRTDAENYGIGLNTGVSSFDTDGFTLQAYPNENGDSNTSGDDYVAWCWKAGGAAVTNTDGTITSQVSANVDAGFSIVSYTGNGVGGTTVGHGLSSAPSIVITKGRSFGDVWLITGTAIGDNNTNYLLFSTAAMGSSATVGSSNPTTLDIGTSTASNTSGATFIAYCFAEVAGFSKFGSYSGTGTTSGNIVVTGFEPAFVMIKRTDALGFWTILDNKRDTTNPNDKPLYANASNAESTGQATNFLINGFQPVTLDSDVNASGTNNYIYMAFANQF